MTRKRDLVIAVLVTFCLTATLFLMKSTRSQAPGQYDPWLDTNDDGKILIEDVAWVAKAFGTSGDPTRYVTIANYSSTTTSAEVSIPASTSGSLDMNVDGYSEATIAFSTLTYGPIDMRTGFVIGNSYVPFNGFKIGADTSRPNAIWLDPVNVSTAGMSIGSKFNVTASVNITSSSYAWYVECHFDPTYLVATREGLTNGITSEFFSAHETVPAEWSGDGYIGGTENLLGMDLRPPGTGSLCWFEFQIVSPITETSLSITNEYTYMLDPDLQRIPITTWDALVTNQPQQSEPYVEVYDVIGPVLRINYANPNSHAVKLRIDSYLSTAP